MIFRNHRSHYYKVSPAEAAEMRRSAALGDMICSQLRKQHPHQKLYTHSRSDDDMRDPCPCDDCQHRNRMHTNKKFVVNPDLRAHSSRGDMRDFVNDEVQRRVAPLLKQIAKLNSMLKTGVNISDETRDFLNRLPVSDSSDPAFHAMSASVGLAGADFHTRAAERKRMSDDYVRRNSVERRNAVTNSDDPAVQAMSSGGLLAHLRKEGK